MFFSLPLAANPRVSADLTEPRNIAAAVAQLAHAPDLPDIDSPRICEILTCDGGLERLLHLLRDFC